MARLPNPLRHSPPFDPAGLDLDARLDLLVDDELPEAVRRDTLVSLDTQPAAWRTLATRFLERQTERQAVRQLIAQAAPAADIPPTYSFRPRTTYGPLMRNLAAALMIAALGIYGGAHWGRTPGPDSTGPNFAIAGGGGTVNVKLPPGIMLDEDDAGQSADMEVPVVAQNTVPEGYPFTNNADEAGGTRHVVIMPAGDRGVVAIPVISSPIGIQ